MRISIKKRIRIWCRVLWALFRTREGVPCNILSAEETVGEVLNGKSLIRFGDGEFGIYQGKNIHYQDWSPALKEEFERIKDWYEKEYQNCPYLLAVPNKFMKMNSKSLLRKRVWASSWAEARMYFKNNFDMRLIYGDAFVFEKKNQCIYEQIWNSEMCQNIIFIHNDEKYAKSFEEKYNKKVVYIKCPARNAFQELQSIVSECEKKIATYQMGKKVQLVVSAGPAGKVLVLYFAEKGYQCIDTGHCWDEPLESD